MNRHATLRKSTFSTYSSWPASRERGSGAALEFQSGCDRRQALQRFRIEQATDVNMIFSMKTTILRVIGLAVLVGTASLSSAALPNAANDVAPPSWRGSANAVAAGSTFTKALFTAVNGNDGPLVAGAYPATPATWTIGTNYFTTFVAPSTAVQIYSNSWMYNPYGTSYVAVTKGSGSWSANALASISHLVEGTWKLATPSSASFMTVSIPDKTADLPVDAYRYAYVQVTAEYAASPFVPIAVGGSERGGSSSRYRVPIYWRIREQWHLLVKLCQCLADSSIQHCSHECNYANLHKY